MTQKLILPLQLLPTSDFFSHQWYEKDGFGMIIGITEDLYSRIDCTRTKLTYLESKLSQRLETDRYNPDLRSFWDRVGWLRGYIGLWTADGDEWDTQQVYPHSKQVISQWPQNLFGERKEGNVLILLSPSSITWLNAVDKWVSTVASSTTVSST